jgi:HlyD family secretion protein
VNKPLVSSKHPVAPHSETRLPLRVVERSDQGAVFAPVPPSRWIPWTWLLLFLVLIGAGLAAYVSFPAIQGLVQQRAAPQSAQAPIVVPVPQDVLGLGKLRPEENVIAVAAPYGASDARIADMRVKEGSAVKKGDIIAVLDSAPSLQSAVDTARANLEVQRAIVEQTKYASTASRDEAVASLESARAVEEAAKLDLDRTSTLFRRGISAKASLDQKQSTYNQARRAVQRAEATLTRFDRQKVPGRQDVVVAERRVQASEADLKRAEQDLERAYIRAPANGTVLSLDNRVGEKPSQNGMATMADLTHMIAEVEVYQSNIGRVAIGQRVVLSSEALGEPLKGSVSYIGLEVKRQEVVGSEPAANTDARIVEVHVALDSASTERARALTNLQVTARIEIDPAP